MSKNFSSEIELKESEFDFCFTGKFAPTTIEEFANIAADGRLITTGQVFQLVQEDRNAIRIVLDGPIDAMKGKELVVRPYAFRSLELVHVKDETTGEFVPQYRDERTEMKIRSVVVSVGGGFGMRFKYNGLQRRIIVC